MDVQGDTDTPDFTVEAGGHPGAAQDEVSRDRGRHEWRHGPAAGRRVLPEVIAHRVRRDHRRARARRTHGPAECEDGFHAARGRAAPCGQGGPPADDRRPHPDDELRVAAGKIDVVKKLQLDGSFSIAVRCSRIPACRRRSPSSACGAGENKRRQGRRNRCRRISRARSGWVTAS